MLEKNFVRYFLFLVSAVFITSIAQANVSTGVWFNYKYQTDPSDNPDQETWGTFGDEALIVYLDHQADDSMWIFSGEFRVGPGSFTDPENNSTGDSYLLHKAWVGYNFANEGLIKIGKSQVPFGWKTTNFWPGDMLLGGYGDQMDVGVNYSHSVSKAFNFSVAYFHADDWGATSTDTADDNGHWGSSVTYRKVQTAVTDMQWSLVPSQNVGFSLQAGFLQDLNEAGGANSEYQDVTGDHQAVSFYYVGEITEQLTLKGQIDSVRRSLPDSLLLDTVENIRAAMNVNYKRGQWDLYIDVTAAKSNTEGNTEDSVYALAPGAKYNYGQGWFYIEYLQQTGDIDRNGDVVEGDFSALYLTVDYYFSF